MSLLGIRDSIAEINAEKVFATSHASTSTTFVIDLNAVTDPINGQPLCSLDGRMQPLLVLQCDQDFAYAFTTDSAATITVATAVLVKQNDQEYVRPLAQTNRRYLAIIRSTADGTVKVFRSAAAK